VTRRLAFALGIALALTSVGSVRAAEETDALRGKAAAALLEGRPGEAIDDLEALADRGVRDGRVSFDRGLAYAHRVRAGKEQPGDLGRAAHGFEEARALTEDPRLGEAATGALAILRSEVARRRAQADDPVEIERGPPLGRSISHLLPEDAWSVLAACASLALAIGLFVRALAAGPRGRVGGSITASLAAPALILGACMALVSRHERMTLREGVVVAASARPADERGIALPNATTLPEAALVDLVGERPGWVQLRWGNVEGWVPQSAVRALARP
jgi:hypothetical protein